MSNLNDTPKSFICCDCKSEQMISTSRDFKEAKEFLVGWPDKDILDNIGLLCNDSLLAKQGY